MTLAEQVAELLQKSIAAHKQAKQARKEKNAALNRELLTEARAYRLDAHALDPEHVSPAWEIEQKETPVGKDTHTEMLAFYDRQLRDEL